MVTDDKEDLSKEVDRADNNKCRSRQRQMVVYGAQLGLSARVDAVAVAKTLTRRMVTFFNSFRKGPMVCRGLDLDLSGKVAKKRL